MRQYGIVSKKGRAQPTRQKSGGQQQKRGQGVEQTRQYSVVSKRAGPKKNIESPSHVRGTRDEPNQFCIGK